MTQIAAKIFCGGDGTFQLALDELMKLVGVARQVLGYAEQYLPGDKYVPTAGAWDPHHVASQDWQLDERWGVALVRQVQTVQGLNLRFWHGCCEVATQKGLRFSWSRLDESDRRGYLLEVVHPSGKFPEGSTLRASLEAQGWKIRSYDENGRYIH